MLSAAKHLTRRAMRCFAALSMTNDYRSCLVKFIIASLRTPQRTENRNTRRYCLRRHVSHPSSIHDAAHHVFMTHPRHTSIIIEDKMLPVVSWCLSTQDSRCMVLSKALLELGSN